MWNITSDITNLFLPMLFHETSILFNCFVYLSVMVSYIILTWHVYCRYQVRHQIILGRFTYNKGCVSLVYWWIISDLTSGCSLWENCIKNFTINYLFLLYCAFFAVGNLVFARSSYVTRTQESMLHHPKRVTVKKFFGFLWLNILANWVFT